MDLIRMMSPAMSPLPSPIASPITTPPPPFATHFEEDGALDFDYLVMTLHEFVDEE
jgi:hypothetical protein